ncbi:MAG: hypothetical protein AAFW84_31795, partial [Cyanobacteria bacterium J06635_15]
PLRLQHRLLLRPRLKNPIMMIFRSKAQFKIRPNGFDGKSSVTDPSVTEDLLEFDRAESS